MARFAAEPVVLALNHPNYREATELAEDTMASLVEDLLGHRSWLSPPVPVGLGCVASTKMSVPLPHTSSHVGVEALDDVEWLRVIKDVS